MREGCLAYGSGADVAQHAAQHAGNETIPGLVESELLEFGRVPEHSCSGVMFRSLTIQLLLGRNAGAMREHV